MPSEKHQADKPIALRDLLRRHTDMWLISGLLGVAACTAAVCLLMVSGWFLAASALAGLVALGSHRFNYMLPAAVIRMLAIIRTAARYGELSVSHHTVFGLLKNLRVSVFTCLAAQPLQPWRGADSARQMHRLVSDIDTLDEFPLRVVAPWLQAACLSVLLAAVISIALPSGGVWVGLLLLGVLLLPLAALRLGQRDALCQSEIGEQRRRALLHPLRMLTRLVLWRQWTAQQQPCLQADDALTAVAQRIRRTANILSLLAQWWFAAVCAALLWLGAAALQQGQTDVPWLLALLLGVFGLQEYVLPLCSNFSAYGFSRAAQMRINALINVPPAVSDGLPLPQGRLKLSAQHLSARLPDALIGPRVVSFDIASGTPCWIMGASGCGKSTLLSVLAQELPPLAGSLTLNGADSRDFDWRGQIGYLSQYADIFAQTLAQNLRLGKPDATDSELTAALEKVALQDWLAQLPQGLDTPLGEYGAAVSGGQARRIALARLLLTPKRLLLLDEPFAGLDSASRHTVWQAVRDHQRDGLLVVVSHQMWEEIEAADLCRVVLPEADYSV
ncbi:thiol reductant ABC exporter subunit CydC [Neisseria perflava]|uniref:thiol reductant ABC exporter subunit CydC n=1 Tax=Neisseria perflava TaxID=33053 RepID=UPI00209CF5BD|nr:thiol reductant ABC exporter subunit CydC [Neisseria perflava]MCP1660859.1 ATP-binding cassette subfamily C protein CydC [Neisseria perflava]MCP1772498.1 ATP-binding cassette subfamily C protein CydC [Neisseria perflava]